MAYDVIFAEVAARQLAGIPPAARTALAAAVDEIAADPYRGRRYHEGYPPELRTMTSGSWGLLAYVIRGFRAEAAQATAAVYDQATSPLTLRTRAQVAAFFDGWGLIEPGLVQVPLWRPDGRPPRPKDLARIWVYDGVARKDS